MTSDQWPVFCTSRQKSGERNTLKQGAKLSLYIRYVLEKAIYYLPHKLRLFSADQWMGLKTFQLLELMPM